MPDPDRPSSDPLTDADADRLSERFTASWDEPAPVPAPVVAAPPAPAPAPVPPWAPIAAPAPAPFGQTVPLPAVQPKAATAPVTSAPVAPIATRPPVAAAAPAPAAVAKPKQTLLGIAPIVVVGPSQPPAAKPAAALPISAPPASSAEASSSPTATAVTTPSKPYIPKDHPLTPAVVISGDVISAEASTGRTRPKEDRARVAQTIPGQRSNPMAAPTPLPAVAIASAKPALSPLDDTYPPEKQGGSKLPWVIGGLALLTAAGIAVVKLSAGPTAQTAEATSSPAASLEAPPIATTGPATEPTPPVTTAPTEAPVASRDSKPEVAESAPEPPGKKSKATKKVSAAPAPRRPVARPEPKPASTPASEPAPTPVPKPAKGVIVRETPF